MRSTDLRQHQARKERLDAHRVTGKYHVSSVSVQQGDGEYSVEARECCCSLVLEGGVSPRRPYGWRSGDRGFHIASVARESCRSLR
jgi:hypothetical protein